MRTKSYDTNICEQKLLKCLLLCVFQSKNTMSSALINEQTLSCGEMAWALTNKSSLTNSSSPTFSPLSPPDLIWTKTPPANCKADLQVRRHQLFFVSWKQNHCAFMNNRKTKTLLCSQMLLSTAKPAPSSIISSSCRPTPEEEKLLPKVAAPSLVRAPPILKTLSLLTPDLGQGMYTHILRYLFERSGQCTHDLSVKIQSE